MLFLNIVRIASPVSFLSASNNTRVKFPAGDLMKYFITGFFSLLIILLPPVAALHASESVIIDDKLTYRNISGAIDYFEDRTRSLTIDDVSADKTIEWKKSLKQHINLGYTKSVYWFRFKAENTSEETISWLLEIDFPPIDLIELYTPAQDGKYIARKAGDTLPFSAREIKYINYVFSMSQEPGSMISYIRIDSLDAIDFNLNIMNRNTFMDRFHNEMPVYWMFFGLMIIMIMYNLGYFIITCEAGYFYLANFIITYALLEFNLKGFAYQYFWPDSSWWTNHANAVFAALLIFWITLFIADFTNITMPWNKQKSRHPKSHSWPPFLVIALSLLLAIASLFINLQISLMLMYGLALINITGAFINGIYAGYFRKKPSRQTRIANMAFSIFALLSPVLILSLTGVIPPNILSRWSMQIGTSFAVVFLSFGMADKIRNMKKNIRAAERRYSHLVENTSEIIFTLDDKNCILNINSAVKMHLGYRPDELVNMNILDLLQETWNNKPEIARQMVLDYISTLTGRKKRSIQFRITLKNKFSHEPQELTMTLEYTGDMDTGYTILGKASPIIDDVLSDFLVTEQYSYNLNNYFTNAEMMSQRLVRNLNRFTDSAVIMQIRMALREAIINSIEHGNLNLTFDDKTGLPDGESYFNIIKERQMDPALTEKKVTINYSLTPDKVTYEISDEGKGFDYLSMLERDPVSPENLMLGHGRGLLMITSAFDRVEFNDKGNCIVLVKYFRRIE